MGRYCAAHRRAEPSTQAIGATPKTNGLQPTPAAGWAPPTRSRHRRPPPPRRPWTGHASAAPRVAPPPFWRPPTTAPRAPAPRRLRRGPVPPADAAARAPARAGRRCQRRRGAGPALGGQTTGRWGSHPAVTDRAGGPRATGDAPRASPRRADRSGSGGRVRQRRHGRHRGGALAVAQEVGVGWGELEKMGGGAERLVLPLLLALCGVALPCGATQAQWRPWSPWSSRCFCQRLKQRD